MAKKVGLKSGVHGRVEAMAPAPPPEAGENPELSRIIHILQGWPPERLALLRKLLETADTYLSGFG